MENYNPGGSENTNGINSNRTTYDPVANDGETTTKILPPYPPYPLPHASLAPNSTTAYGWGPIVPSPMQPPSQSQPELHVNVPGYRYTYGPNNWYVIEQVSPENWHYIRIFLWIIMGVFIYFLAMFIMWPKHKHHQ